MEQKGQKKNPKSIQKLWVRDRETKQRIGILESLTTRDIMMTCDNYIEPQKQMQCEIELTQKVKGSNTIVVNTECVSSEEIGTTHKYQVGLNLLDVAPMEKEKIQYVIDANILPQQMPTHQTV